MNDDKEKKLQQRKTQFILYGMLWLLLMIIVSAFAYQEHATGTATIFSAVDKVSHFGFFYWLNPVTWGKCINGH